MKMYKSGKGKPEVAPHKQMGKHLIERLYLWQLPDPKYGDHRLFFFRVKGLLEFNLVAVRSGTALKVSLSKHLFV